MGKFYFRSWGVDWQRYLKKVGLGAVRTSQSRLRNWGKSAPKREKGLTPAITSISEATNRKQP